MAISFIKDISETNFLFSHNNNVIEFYSDSVEVVTTCVITINSKVIVLYPSPANTFYFNFKEVVSTLINKNNYKDDLQTDISVSYTYDWASRVYLNGDVDIKINFANDTFDTVTKDLNFILSAVNQLDYNRRFPYETALNKTVLGLPLIDKANNKFYAKYWNGYPFDLGVFKGVDSIDEILIDNASNGLNYSFPLVSAKGFERLVFSDGNSSTTIENALPLVIGFNDLTVSTEITPAYLLLEKEDGCDGVYLKWINDKGGYSYWLFKSNQSQRNFKNLGYLQNDNNNLEDTISPEVSLGYRSNDSFTVYENLLREEQKNLIVSMLDSPKVYMFTGTPFSQNNFNDWLEVKLKQSKFPITQVKRNLYNIKIAFSLPNNSNITL